MSFHYRGYEIPDKMYVKQYYYYATNEMYVLARW